MRFGFFMANYQTCSSTWEKKMLPLVSVIQWAEHIDSDVSDQLVSLAAEWLQEEEWPKQSPVAVTSGSAFLGPLSPDTLSCSTADLPQRTQKGSVVAYMVSTL